MKVRKRPSKKLVILAVLVFVFSFLFGLWLAFDKAFAPIVPFAIQPKKIEAKTEKKPAKVVQTKVASNQTNTSPSAAATKYSTTDPSSIWVVVNKSHKLNPIAHSPTDLITVYGATISSKAKTDFVSMITSASAAGVALPVVSSYRSYYTQQALYNNYVATYGQASADTFSARPGYSEHQTGLAIDFGSNTLTTCNFDSCFGQTVEGKWLATNSYKYGFTVRYTAAKQSITGYKDEPWHYRYIGKNLAVQMRNESITTLEEYFGISGGTVYK